LWWLYRDDLLPTNTFFLGYARSSIKIDEFLTKVCYQYMKVLPDEEEKFKQFVKLNYYLAGSYDKLENFEELNLKILEISKEHAAHGIDCNRIFYLALPPSVYSSVTHALSHCCKAKK
jgi:glucose-6-phosphate 1-dehydrogenase